MSESNNKKGNKLLKFVFLYTIFILAVTAILIFLNYKYNINVLNYFKENNQEDEMIQEEIEIKKPVENKEIDYNEIKRTTLLDKYYINNIELKEKKLTYGNIVNYNSYDGSPIYKASLSYIEIDGLKDKEVQNKINRSIEEKAKSLITDKEIYDDSIETIHIVAGTSADYSTADLISMPVTKETVYKENKGHDEIYVTEYCPSINYRLDTGEELKLEDLFTKDANIKNILAKTVYKSLGFDYGLNEDTGDGDLDIVDYGKIENDVYNIIHSFYNQKENIFWFNQEQISVAINDNWYNITNSDFYDYINFNNITDNKTSIYENGNNPKINYVFAQPFMSGLEYFDKVSNNSYLSIFNWYRYAGELINDEPEVVKYTNKLLDNVDEIENIIKNDNKKESGKGYIYNIYNYVEEYSKYDMESEDYINLGTCFMGEKVEVDLDDFMTNVENAYALNSKQSTGGEYVFSFNNLVYTNKYKIWDIMIRDTDNDGKLEIGQKPNEIIEDWDNYVEKDYEY